MKKFELTVKDGRRIIYQSIFSYTPEQEKAYLAKILEQGTDRYLFESELEVVVMQTIGEKRWQKEWKKWNEDMTLRDYVEQYPDIAICAAIQNNLYNCDVIPHLDSLGPTNGAKEEVLIDHSGSCGWKCVLLP